MPDYPRDERIDKLNSTDEIVKYFQYEDKYGDEFSPIHYDSWNKQPIEVQREVAQGLQYAKDLFKLDMLPNKIEFKKLGNNTYGQIELISKTLSINSSKVKQVNELYGTAVHEMTHYYDYISGNVSQSIVDKAIKNLKLSKNSREIERLRAFIVGGFDKNVWFNENEVFAYSIELHGVKKGNKLSDEIFKILRENK